MATCGRRAMPLVGGGERLVGAGGPACNRPAEPGPRALPEVRTPPETDGGENPGSPCRHVRRSPVVGSGDQPLRGCRGGRQRGQGPSSAGKDAPRSGCYVYAAGAPSPGPQAPREGPRALLEI